jgi:TetR/AcrR family transcriptional repressor of nem operon
MRKSRTAAAQTKATIIGTAARLFRERGFDAVSINDVMSAAGLTIGGFYRHFESKEALAAAAIEAATVESNAQREEGPLAPEYLSALHRDNPGHGCPVAALVSEVARQTAPARAAFTDAVRALVARLEPETGDRSAALRRTVELVGAIALARAVRQDDKRLSDEILRAVR